METTDRYLKLTESSIPKLIMEMAIPSTLSMLVGIIYSLADTYFVSKVSTEATAAVGLAFSFMSVIQALGLLFGHGSGNYISRMEGAKNKEESSKMAINGLVISLLVGLLILIVGELFIDDLVSLLGATENLQSLTKEYLSILLIGSPFMVAALTMNNQYRLQGNATLGAIGIVAGAIINCILDPIFIFNLDLGVKGAAYATIIGQIIGFFILLFANKLKGNVKFDLSKFSVNKEIIKELLGGGAPNFTREIFIALSLAILNNSLKMYGESYIASFTIVNRIMLVGTYIVVGIGHGFQPVCGFNYGANLYDRVKKALSYTLKFTVIFVIFVQILFFLTSTNLIGVFRNDSEIIDIGSNVLRIQAMSLPLIAYITIAGMFLQNTHKFKDATMITTARQGYVYIPLIYILHYIFGLNGVLYVQPISDVITFIISIILVRKRKLELV